MRAVWRRPVPAVRTAAVSPELAAERGLENAGWATIVSACSAIEARVLVTSRMTPLTVAGRVLHQVGLPWHWGPNGLTTGDAANELAHLSLDPNVHIQEVKALAVDIRPGRRSRGPALRELVRDYQERAPASATGSLAVVISFLLVSISAETNLWSAFA